MISDNDAGPGWDMMGEVVEPAPVSSPQENMELDPNAHDPSGNADVEEFGIAPAMLFEQALEQTRMAIAISDPYKPDQPLIYLNQAFTELTGYSREEALGRNCRFLQGPASDPETVREISEALVAEKVKVVELLNYRRDGTTFWNALHVGPIYDAAGRLTHYYGSQWDVTDLVEKRRRIALQAEVAEELQHRTGNLFAVMSSIVRMSARAGGDANALAARVDARLQALGKAHAISISHGMPSAALPDLAALTATILEPYAADGRSRFDLDGPTLAVPRKAVTPIGLMLHELATNAVKYGALSEPTGRIRVRWRVEDDRLALTWTEEGGPEVAAPAPAGTGTRIVDGVLATVNGRIIYDWTATGLAASLDMPLAEEG